VSCGKRVERLDREVAERRSNRREHEVAVASVGDQQLLVQLRQRVVERDEPDARAAVRLVRIAPDAERARRIEALRAVHAAFTEGSEGPDLIDAATIVASSTP
jgi:hypothetical protein